MNTELPDGWQANMLDVASSMAVGRDLKPDSATSREADPNVSIPFSIVRGRVIARELPWLYDLYHGRFRDLAQQSFPSEDVVSAQDIKFGITLNV